MADVEIETEKASVQIPSPASGFLQQVSKAEEEFAKIRAEKAGAGAGAGASAPVDDAEVKVDATTAAL